MSYRGALGWAFSDAAPPPPPTPFDYLYPTGVGLALLQSVAKQTTDLLLSNKGGYIVAGKQSTAFYPPTTYVPADPIVAAVWGGHTESANLLGSIMVSTIVAEERRKTSGRYPVTSLVGSVVKRIIDMMHNSGDPSSCMIAFESSVGSWKSLYPVVRSPSGTTSTGWCKRDLVFVGGCKVGYLCAMTMDSKGVPQAISAPPPPSGAVTAPAPASASAPTPPPTHAQIDAAVAEKMKSSGESLEQMEQAQELSELGVYLGALSQARTWLILALGLQTTASDQMIWDALSARGIDPAESIDWFTACDGGIDCFRERLNAALGETDTIARDTKSKTLVLAGVAVAATFAFLTWKRRR